MSEPDVNMSIGPSPQVDIQPFRKLVRSYIDLHLYSSALFWADKVVSLSKEDPHDVYWLAQCMFHLRHYHRAALLIRSKGLDKTHNVCRYLAANCLLEAKEYNEALVVLFGDENESLNFTNPSFKFNSDNASIEMDGFSDANLHSAMLYLAGRIYESLDNRSLASECYKQALSTDINCYEAFQSLIQHQMLTDKEEKELMNTLFEPASRPYIKTEEHSIFKTSDVLTTAHSDNKQFVRMIYQCLTNKYHKVTKENSLEIPSCLKDNLDMEVARAERCYYACAYSECFSITQQVLKNDPYHTACLPVRIACLVELQKTNELFNLAHDLVDHYPEMAVSWFAVGCYYSLKGKSDPARRFLGKATTLDKLFGPGWLAYGHSFAVESEHDQAMAAYFKASQLLKGCHLPLLYIGLECGLTNNIKLAEKFFLQSQLIAPEDPFVIHEMGVVAFRNNDFEKAETYFEDALRRLTEIDETIIAEKWEPLYNNLGHTYRKLKKYDKALEFHHRALVLSPRDGSTFSSIGFVQALMGDVEAAIESFHKALGLRRDDTFSSSMLNTLMEQTFQDGPIYHDCADDDVMLSGGVGSISTVGGTVCSSGSAASRTNVVQPQISLSPCNMTLESDITDSFNDENS